MYFDVSKTRLIIFKLEFSDLPGEGDPESQVLSGRGSANEVALERCDVFCEL